MSIIWYFECEVFMFWSMWPDQNLFTKKTSTLYTICEHVVVETVFIIGYVHQFMFTFKGIVTVVSQLLATSEANLAWRVLGFAESLQQTRCPRCVCCINCGMYPCLPLVEYQLLLVPFEHWLPYLEVSALVWCKDSAKPCNCGYKNSRHSLVQL